MLKPLTPTRRLPPTPALPLRGEGVGSDQGECGLWLAGPAPGHVQPLTAASSTRLPLAPAARA